MWGMRAARRARGHASRPGGHASGRTGRLARLEGAMAGRSCARSHGSGGVWRGSCGPGSRWRRRCSPGCRTRGYQAPRGGLEVTPLGVGVTLLGARLWVWVSRFWVHASGCAGVRLGGARLQGSWRAWERLRRREGQVRRGSRRPGSCGPGEGIAVGIRGRRRQAVVLAGCQDCSRYTGPGIRGAGGLDQSIAASRK